MYLLIVDDDRRLTRLLAHMFAQAGHTVDVAHDGAEAQEYLQQGGHEVLILDWMLPGTDGITLCATAREGGFEGGILMLTARDALEDRLEGFGTGADDYLIKPFEPDELLARAEALARRAARPPAPRVIETDAWALDCNDRRMQHASGCTVELTQREFQLVELLMRRAGNAVARETIHQQLWGLDGEVTDNALDATLRLLRRKLSHCAGEQPIQTLRGFGYRFEPGA